MMRIIIFYFFIPAIFSTTVFAQIKYVGVNVCKNCHQGRDDGSQFEIWRGSKHSEAFKTLSSRKAAKIAKEKGLKSAASESNVCRQCHTIDAGKILEKDGVQCESCHGAGLNYKTRTVMMDREKAISAGMTDFRKTGSIEAKCRSCHNEKSPTYKQFNFQQMWKKIKHPIPK